MKPTGAVIFDMDGVIIDSEPLYKRINITHFEQLGVEINDKEYDRFVGISANLMWNYIKEKGQLKQSIDALKLSEERMKNEWLRKEKIHPMPGLVESLDYLKNKDYCLAVASSTAMQNIKLVINRLQIGRYFNQLVSGEEVENGKPSPDIFLETAQRMKIKPHNCVVIEDSHNGVKAAKAAGMFCIGFQNANSGNQDLSMADVVIASFEKFTLKNILENGIPKIAMEYP